MSADDVDEDAATRIAGPRQLISEELRHEAARSGPWAPATGHEIASAPSPGRPTAPRAAPAPIAAPGLDAEAVTSAYAPRVPARAGLPSVFVWFLFACALLSFLGIALLVYLKVENRW